jgi:hypothetical protein
MMFHPQRLAIDANSQIAAETLHVKLTLTASGFYNLFLSFFYLEHLMWSR